MSDTDATQARQDVVAEVDEILEHVINGNMLSMPYDVYFELFDAVAGLGVEIENLQAENAKLREENERFIVKLNAEHIVRQNVEADIAKLRELAAKMAEALRVGGEWCDRECIVVFGCDGMDECPIAKELRELGVEVDG